MPARAFLFPPDDPHDALTRFIAGAASSTGFMKGAPGAPLPGMYRVGGDNRAMLANLLAGVQETHPQAGPAYWAVQLWTTLLWQPAYLAAIAVHHHGALPSLMSLGQGIKGVYADGYRLTPGPQETGTTEVLIGKASSQLAAIATALLGEVNGLIKLKPVPARRLLADRMLGIMLWLHRKRPDLPVADIHRICGLWLEGLGLTGHGALETIRVPDGRETLIIARKGCCLDYLSATGGYCASCPKQADDVRRERQITAAIAELG